jgi:predicted DNA-binding transcriptional regulator AlpA
MSQILLAPREVAQRLRLAPSTLAKLRLRGGGPPYIKLGAAVRYPEDSLIQWIASQRRRDSTAQADASKS